MGQQIRVFFLKSTISPVLGILWLPVVLYVLVRAHERSTVHISMSNVVVLV